MPSHFSLPYWEGCGRGELCIIRCHDCGQAIVDAPRICWRCHSRDLRWEVATGGATLSSWTIVWRPQTPDFEVPYAVAILTLDEGVEFVSSVVGCERATSSRGWLSPSSFTPSVPKSSSPAFARPWGVSRTKLTSCAARHESEPR